VLGKLPAVGWLFRNEKKSDDRTELMIFVTPKILQQTVPVT
jgi:type IV pilus assembly protein PilQ